MSLDVYLKWDDGCWEANITHNCNAMADAAGIYKAVWRPEEVRISKARQLIKPLKAGLAKMVTNPKKFRALEASNGWGTLDDFIPWLMRYLEACIAHPDAEVTVSR
jgi:hypothetical protein